jgi:hypothetical protein
VVSFWNEIHRVLFQDDSMAIFQKDTRWVGALWNYTSVHMWHTLASQPLFSKRHSPGVLEGGANTVVM